MSLGGIQVGRDLRPPLETRIDVAQQRLEVGLLLGQPASMQRKTLGSIQVGVEPKDPGEFKNQRMHGARIRAYRRVVFNS